MAWSLSIAPLCKCKYHPSRRRVGVRGVARTTAAPAACDIAVLVSYSGDGGVERMMVNLAGALARTGRPVDLIRARATGSQTRLPEGVRVIDLPTNHTRTAAGPLAHYLRNERPAGLLAAKDRANRVAVRARNRAGTGTPLAVRVGTHLGESLRGRSRLHRALRYRLARATYSKADAVVAVSRGVAEDLARIVGLDPGAIRVVPNPVITPALHEQAEPAAEHPWLAPERAEPVLLAAGRLTRQKDFATLLRAFARLQLRTPARLVILGEGPKRGDLEALARELGIADRVDLPGFLANPYPVLARADLFVLSSAWEGSPNVLTEALALGTPVVATDCPSGPRELLGDGHYGPLVPVGDDTALAQAMAGVLDHPPEAATLQEAVTAYNAEASARAYLGALGITPPKDKDRAPAMRAPGG